jgi:prepilin-type processing-associated H-X9-DG protein
MYRTADEFAGRTATCPRCSRELTVPDVSAGLEVDDEAQFPRNTTIYCRRALQSFLFGFCSLGLAFVTGIPGVIFGVQGLREIRHGQGKLQGKWLAVLGILLGLIGTTVTTTSYVIPAVRYALAAQRRYACVENMKQIGLALHNYVSDIGHYPLPAITDGRGTPLLSWRVAILPYLGPEAAALYRRFNLNEPWNGPNNSILLNQMPAVYACPEFPMKQQTVYQALAGPGTIFTRDKAMRIQDIKRGTSNTLCIIEAPNSVAWSSPFDIDVESPSFDGTAGTQHLGGSNSLYADGSVR